LRRLRVRRRGGGHALRYPRRGDGQGSRVVRDRRVLGEGGRRRPREARREALRPRAVPPREGHEEGRVVPGGNERRRARNDGPGGAGGGGLAGRASAGGGR